LDNFNKRIKQLKNGDFPMGKREGKKRISADELKRLRNDGWRFRTKTAKGKRYISARKGKDEQGLGPFSEELWGEIQNLTDLYGGLKEGASIKEKTSNEERENLRTLGTVIKERLRVRRGAHMARCCLFKDGENYCEYWLWDKEPQDYSIITNIYGENMFRVSGDEAAGSRRWAIKAFSLTCAGCPAFVDERMKKLSKEKESK
jgi:ribosomal protein L34